MESSLPGPGERAEGARGVTRRAVLGAAVAGAAVASTGMLAAPDAAGREIVPRISADTRITLRRREDLLRLPLLLTSVTRSDSKAMAAVFLPTASTARLVADLGPQHLVERVFTAEEFGPDGKAGPAAGARLAGPSRLAFVIPASGIPATLDGLLAWGRLQASVSTLGGYRDGQSIPAGHSAPRDPSATQTAIEMPWWLVLSPHDRSSWAHALRPVTRAGRTEVWHTRLAWNDLAAATPIATAREDAGTWPTGIFTVRAVWLRDPGAVALIATTGTPDPPIYSEGHPFRMTPRPRDRADIVRLSSRTSAGVSAVNGGAARAIPVSMSLSPLGGTMHVDAAWDSPAVASLTTWQQRSWQGRDTHARTVRQGYLYPWGIPAALDQQVTRAFIAASTGGVRPYQLVTTTVVVTSPTVSLDHTLNRYRGRATPFTRITCLTRATPELAGAPVDLFVPEVRASPTATAPVLFEFVGTDQAGRQASFRMPALFVERRSPTVARSDQVIAAYNSLDASVRTCDLGGTGVAFAPETQAARGQTTVSTLSAIIELTAPASSASASRRDAYPRMATAEVILEDLSRIAGSRVSATMEFAQAYLESGFDAGANQLEAYLKGAPAEAVSLGGRQAGGMMSMALDVAGLSRTLGVVPGDVADLEALCADPVVQRAVDLPTDGIAKAFGAIKLLGGISLADILGGALDLGDGAPRINTTVSGVGTPSAVSTTTMTWTPGLDVVSGTLADGILDVSDAALTITVTSVVSLTSGESTWTSVGELTGLTVQLVRGAPFITVELSKLTFSAGSEKGPSIDVVIGDVTFMDVLALLATFQEYIPIPIGGLTLDVGRTGITAGYSLDLPDLAIGAYTLTGIGVGCGLTIPFDDEPMRFRFSFSDPDNPFGMTVLGVGGAGWFTVAMGIDCVERIEIAAGVQGYVAVDFGVASGGVRLMVGIQFELLLESGSESLILTAFARLVGRVEVIEVVEASIEVYIGLSALIPKPGQRVILAGEASVTVKVSVSGLSKTVRWRIRRSVKGAKVPPLPDFASAPARLARADDHPRGRADPEPEVVTVSFGDGMPYADWVDWCGAFA